MLPIFRYASRVTTLLRFVAPLLISGVVFSLFAAQFDDPTTRFDREDLDNPVPPGIVVFTGASTIAYWDSLHEDMNPLQVVNRAFAGSEYSDMIRYVDRLVIGYRPSAVVVYAGDNDLAWPTRKTPRSVLDDVRQYVDLIHAQLPETWVYVISIKPSHARWNAWPQMKEANQLIADYLRTQDRAQFIDLASVMLDANGDLPRDLFSDGLHPSAKGYVLWTAIIKPVLMERFGTSTSSDIEPSPVAASDAVPVAEPVLP